MIRTSRLTILLTLLLGLFAMPAFAGIATSYDEPDTVLASNTVIDFIVHNNGLWMATGDGISFTLDSGRTWLLYNNENGLVSNSISAMHSMNNRLWIGTNHDVEVDGDIISLSDGISFTDDDGDNWTQVDFEALGFEGIKGVLGANRNVFDITGHYDPLDPYSDDNWLFMTAWAAGFLTSRDGGNTWRRLYASSADSINYEIDTLSELSFTNRYFSGVADSTHGDSLFVWAGSAGGVSQYIFAIPRDKSYGAKMISRIIFNPDADSLSNNNYVFFAGDVGVTRGYKRGGPYLTRFAQGDPRGTNDGLTGPYTTAVYFFGGRLLAGSADSANEVGTGLAYSDDFGNSYQMVAGYPATGIGNRIKDFASIGERIYLAGEEAGLFVSTDTGMNWTHLWVDATDTSAANRRNTVHALAAIGDTLRVGTDSGLVTLYMNPTGLVDSSWNFVFNEDDSSSTKVVRIYNEEFLDPADSTFDSLAVWTINYPLTISGEYCVRRTSAVDPRHFVDTSFQVGVKTNDLEFFTDSVFAAGAAGVRFSTFNGRSNMTFTLPIRESSLETMDNDEITVFKAVGDTVFVGSDNGFAISYDRGVSFDITRVNRDTLAADAVVRFTTDNTGGQDIGISGNFIPALGLQYNSSGPANIWTSNRPGPFGGANGISVGAISQGIFQFTLALPGRFAWNFEFTGDTVFAATDDGLVMNSAALGTQWVDLPLVDSLNNPLADPGTPVYGLQKYADALWIGSGDGTFKMNLSTLAISDRFVYVDSISQADVVYAFPVPYSLASETGIDFHFTLTKDATVSLKIYDFALNLVATVMDGTSLPAGIYHAGQDIGIARPKWYGVNDANGNSLGSAVSSLEKVAVGIYHFKFEYSTGEVYWGKLAVTP